MQDKRQNWGDGNRQAMGTRLRCFGRTRENINAGKFLTFYEEIAELLPKDIERTAKTTITKNSTDD